MNKKATFISYFIFLFSFCLIVFILSSLGFLSGPQNILDNAFFPFQKLIYQSVIRAINANTSKQIKTLTDKNLFLVKMLVNQKELELENIALKDQFKVGYPSSNILVEAQVVGVPDFIPGVSTPKELIINKGTLDNIRIDQAVVFKNNLIGMVIKVSDYLATIKLITDRGVSFTVKTYSTQSLGVITGQGGEDMMLENVLTSNNLKDSDLVLTNPGLNARGEGYFPNLIVGKIVTIEKNPASLFQQAQVLSLVDLSKLSTVFVIVGP